MLSDGFTLMFVREFVQLSFLFGLFSVELLRVCIDFFVGVILVSVAILSYVVLLLAIRGVSGDIGILSLQLF